MTKIESILLDESELKKNASLFFDYKKRVKKNLSFKDYFCGDLTHSKDYFSNLCPAFSFEFSSIQDIDKLRLILFRDGIFGICRFFSLYPTPSKEAPVLLISKNLSFLTPPEWREYTFSYDYEYKKNSSEGETDEVILLGHFSCDEIDESIDSLSSKLSQVKEKYPSIKKWGGCLSYQNHFLKVRTEDYLWEIARVFFKKLHENSSFYSIKDLMNKELSKTAVINLNDSPLFYSDSIADFVLSEGGAKFDKSIKKGAPLTRLNAGIYRDIIIYHFDDYFDSQKYNQYTSMLKNISKEEIEKERVDPFSSKELYGLARWVSKALY